jgi:hypothetical protein
MWRELPNEWSAAVCSRKRKLRPCRKSKDFLTPASRFPGLANTSPAYSAAVLGGGGNSIEWLSWEQTPNLLTMQMKCSCTVSMTVQSALFHQEGNGSIIKSKTYCAYSQCSHARSSVHALLALSKHSPCRCIPTASNRRDTVNLTSCRGALGAPIFCRL